jgi:formylglycine-generating enzyme required for sulfatase activity
MRLFISYARVDKYYCSQIVAMLDVHDIWFDNRLQAGQQWWDEIQRSLEWCEGFVYLLSPDSVSSKYCLMEFDIAKALGKHIFPILIQGRTQIPADLQHIQHVDMSSGINTDAVKSILNSIYIAERQGSRVQAHQPVKSGFDRPPQMDQPVTSEDFEVIITEAADAFDSEEYDRAVFLLKQAKASGYVSKYIDLDAMLHEAEDGLEWQAYHKEAQREYAPIHALVMHDRTRKLGCQAFRAFHKTFPDYDPENLAAICLPYNTALLEWCEIPAGEVKIKRGGKVKTYHLEAFEIGKYPVTNAQYLEFIDAADGYCNEDLWDYSIYALRWRKAHPEPIRPRPVGHDHPCVNACWYEAIAFCRWISDKTGTTITLATEQQWLRAAQGDDARLYPWGNTFDKTRCNSRESGMRLTMPVTHYASGVSPYGVFDMAGNTWEWCLNNEYSGTDSSTSTDEDRVIKGGSYIGTYKRAQCTFFYSLNPQCRFDTIGFRLVRLRD